MKNAGPLPLHPFLFVLFTVLSLYARNRARVPLSAVVRPSLIIIGTTFAFLMLLWLLSRHLRRAALATTALLLAIFSYGPVSFFLYGVSPWWFVVIGTGCAAAAFLLPGDRTKTTGAANVATFCMLLAAVLPALRPGNAVPAVKSNDPSFARVDAELQKARRPASAPDIYYIVVDRYASGEVLRRFYGFDNRAFLQALRERGFFVADSSRANYPKTSYALAASLNFDYPHRQAQRRAADASDWKPVNAMLVDHRVGRTLQRLGYRYVHLGSWWEVTARSPIADLNVNPNVILGFDTVLFRNTLLSSLREERKPEYDMRREHWSAERAKFAAIGDMRGSPRRPLFVFAHFLTTHDPYVFAEDGGFVSAGDARATPHDLLYVKQVIFTNGMLLNMIDALQRDRKVPPIIVIQSDEGPLPFKGEHHPEVDWTSLSSEQHDQKSGILTAVSLPAGPSVWWDSISPVNVLRVVFSRTFGVSLPPLPDLQLVYRDERHPYEIYRREAEGWRPAP